MSFCPKCDVVRESKFCPECGTPMGQSIVVVKHGNIKVDDDETRSDMFNIKVNHHRPGIHAHIEVGNVDISGTVTGGFGNVTINK
jgi:hypothetical protein